MATHDKKMNIKHREKSKHVELSLSSDRPSFFFAQKKLYVKLYFYFECGNNGILRGPQGQSYKFCSMGHVGVINKRCPAGHHLI